MDELIRLKMVADAEHEVRDLRIYRPFSFPAGAASPPPLALDAKCFDCVTLCRDESYVTKVPPTPQILLTPRQLPVSQYYSRAKYRARCLFDSNH